MEERIIFLENKEKAIKKITRELKKEKSNEKRMVFSIKLTEGNYLILTNKVWLFGFLFSTKETTGAFYELPEIKEGYVVLRRKNEKSTKEIAKMIEEYTKQEWKGTVSLNPKKDLPTTILWSAYFGGQITLAPEVVCSIASILKTLEPKRISLCVPEEKEKPVLLKPDPLYEPLHEKDWFCLVMPVIL